MEQTEACGKIREAAVDIREMKREASTLDRVLESGCSAGERREALRRKRGLERDIRTQEARDMKPGDGATVLLWTDRLACTVVSRTPRTMTVRRDRAVLSPDPEGRGCVISGQQKWTCVPDEQGEIMRFRWNSALGGWTSGEDGSIRAVPGRNEYRDFTF